MAEEITKDSVLDFFIASDGKVKNEELVSHFRSCLANKDASVRDTAKSKLKDCVSSVAVAKIINDEKYLVLKNKYLELFGSPDPLKTPPRKVELPPEYTADSDLHKVTEHLNNSIEVEKCVDDERQTAKSGLSRESWQPWTGIEQAVPLSERWDPNRPPVSDDVPVMLPMDVSGETNVKTVEAAMAEITLPASQTEDVCESVVTDVGSSECEPTGKVTELTEPAVVVEVDTVKLLSEVDNSAGANAESNKENEPKISVKNLTKKFNESVDEESLDVSPPDDKISQFDDMDSQSYVELDPLEKEWMLKSALCDVSELRRLYKEDKTLIRKKDFTNTALHWAAKHGSKEGVAFLCSTEMDVNTKSGGYTPLHLACQQCHDDIIQILVKCYDADANVRDNYGKKPLLLQRSSTATHTLLHGLQKDLYINKLIHKKPALYSTLPDVLDTHTDLLTDGNINIKRFSQHRKSKDFDQEHFALPRKSKKLKASSKRASVDFHSDKWDF